MHHHADTFSFWGQEWNVTFKPTRAICWWSSPDTTAPQQLLMQVCWFFLWTILVLLVHRQAFVCLHTGTYWSLNTNATKRRHPATEKHVVKRMSTASLDPQQARARMQNMQKMRRFLECGHACEQVKRVPSASLTFPLTLWRRSRVLPALQLGLRHIGPCSLCWRSSSSGCYEGFGCSNLKLWCCWSSGELTWTSDCVCVRCVIHFIGINHWVPTGLFSC